MRIDVGDKPVDLYDAVSHVFVARGACGPTSLRLTEDSAAVIVLAPGRRQETRDGRRLVDGVVVDYR